MRQIREHIRWIFGLSAAALLVLAGCASYQSREVAFRHPTAFANVQAVAGAQIAAEAFADKGKAKEAFGFDIREAGLLPVQVVLDNAGDQALQVVPEQTFLIDDAGGMWNLLENRAAYERLEKSTEYGRIAKGSGKGAFLGATGGAIVGAAIGILVGENVDEAALKGAAVGGAGGAVIGGAHAMEGSDEPRQITRDLANKELKNRSVEPGSMGRGFLFFPGEATSAKQLRLQVKEVGSGKVHTLFLPL